MVLLSETMQHGALTEKLNDLAARSGLDVLGFADASEFKGYRLNHSPRRDPKLSLPDAKTIIVAGVYIGGVTLPVWQDPWYGRTSRLYLSGYFLDMVKPLSPLVELLIDQGFKAIVCDGTTDEGSILPLKLAAVRTPVPGIKNILKTHWRQKRRSLFKRKPQIGKRPVFCLICQKFQKENSGVDLTG